MRWTVSLLAEVEPGQRIEHEIASVDRDERTTPATLGLSIAEGRAALAAIQIPDELEYGGIVGQVNVVDCVTTSDSPWFWGQIGFVCDEAMRLPFVPMKGRLGIFAAEPGIMRRLKRDSERHPRRKRP